MKNPISGFVHSYDLALRTYLKQTSNTAEIASARKLGLRAGRLGLAARDVMNIHEKILPQLGTPARQRQTLKRRGVVFLNTATATMQTPRQLLQQTSRMQEELRYLSRRLLSAQEEERKRISRELHDVVAQTLTGIHVRLAMLNTQSAARDKELRRNIAATQLLVRKSVDIVHRFARDLRPTALDDLGLVPALQSYLKRIGEEAGLEIKLTSFPEVEKWDETTKTVLYRVIQEALANIRHHAKASRVGVQLELQDGCLHLDIRDNGRGFQLDKLRTVKGGERLGILGMRERVEMIGGSFEIHSSPGNSTLIQVSLPRQSTNRTRKKPQGILSRFPAEVSLQTISVLLAEDHQLVREGLRALLNAETDMKVVGEANNGREAVELTRKLRPSVIVMDIAMPLLNGLEATRQILRTYPDVKVIILSAHSDDAYVEHVMGLGASAYLIKQTAAAVLPKAIRDVFNGKTFFSPSISRRRDHQHKRTRIRGEHGLKKQSLKLTSRETEVLQLISEGKANKQTAAELHISIKTVEKHRQSLMEKLNIHDTAGLTRHAIATGMIESSIQSTTL